MDALKLMQQTVPTGKLKWTSDEVDPMKPFHFVRHKPSAFLSAWPAFAVAHHLLVQLAAELSGYKGW